MGGRSGLFRAQGHSSLKLSVEEKAKSFDCLEAISNLTIIDAVRFLQHKERYTPCFGGESPLIPLPEDAATPRGIDKARLCGVLECYWKLPCDTVRMMHVASLEESMDEEVVQEIDESIFRMQLESVSDTRQVVQEAAGLLGEDSQPNAARLLEEAVSLRDQTPQLVRPVVLSGSANSAERQSDETEAVAQILSRLADSARTFFSAIQELVQQGASASRVVRQELDQMRGSVDTLAGVVSEQQASISATPERYQQLSAAVASVQGADARREAEMRALREEAREQTDRVSGRLEELSARLGHQHEEFSGLHTKVESLMPLHSAISDLSSRVAVWCEQFNRQEEVLHSLCEAQTKRAAALQQFFEVLSRLETSFALPSAKP